MKINKENEALLTQEGIKELQHYNPETGEFVWLKKVVCTANIKIGQVAGCLTKHGYVVIKINGKKYQAHRLAWLYVHGYFPDGDNPFIDHIDGNRSNNRIDNLRQASRSENNRNRSANKDSKTGVKGIDELPSGNFRAKIKNPLTKRQEHIGTYPTEKEASEAYAARACEYFGDFYRNKA